MGAVCTGVRRTWWICLGANQCTASKLSRKVGRQPKSEQRNIIESALDHVLSLRSKNFTLLPHSVTRDALTGSWELQLIRPTLRTGVLALIIVLRLRP